MNAAGTTIYVCDKGANQIDKIARAGSGWTLTVLGSGFNRPTGVAVDASGNVYVADGGNNAVKEIPANGGAPVTLASGFLDPKGVAVDAAGNVYVADSGNNAVKEIKIIGGYSINKPLPPGLSFDNNTGTISGTPVTGNPATGLYHYCL